jgi:nitroimidazol reductase NimA-like FMN-containing flavoprotein (pyridoxamine 5'-phosphate oxidase superfamily)
MAEKKITKKDVYLFLKQNKSATISTVSVENTPEAATMYYGVDKGFNFYVVIWDKSRKYANFKRNPKVALVISDEYMLRTVQAEGEAEELKSVKINSSALKTLMEVLSPTVWQTIAHIWDPIPPILKMKNGAIAIFKIKITWLRWGDFSLPVKKGRVNFMQLIIP